jgi:hypothetical protein
MTRTGPARPGFEPDREAGGRSGVRRTIRVRVAVVGAASVVAVVVVVVGGVVAYGSRSESKHVASLIVPTAGVAGPVLPRPA